MSRQTPLTLLLALIGILSGAQAGLAQTVTLQQAITGPPAASFGSGTDSATAVEGNTMIVGAATETSARGAAYVYVRNGGSWTLQQRLVPPDEAGIAMRFGQGVALSGNTVVVGANQARNGGASAIGAAYVFVRSGTTWAPQAKLVASDAASNAGFGASVGIDGNVVVVGAATMNRPSAPQAGAAYVFRRTGTAWTQEQILAAPDAAGGDQFGVSVDISGSTVCVGSFLDDVGGNGDQGSAYVFVHSGTWNFQQHLTAGDGAANNWFGNHCSISGDTIAVGAPQVTAGGQANAGAVYVFTRSGVNWSQQQRLTSNVTGRFSKVSVAGNVLAVGASGEVSGQGAMYVYGRSGSTWSPLSRVGNAAETLGRNFASNVGTDGTTIIAGIPSASPSSGAPGGAVAVFTLQQSGVPGAPTNFNATADGNTVTMSWNPPASGGTPTGYTLIARAPGGAVLLTQTLGLVHGVSASGPNGTYVLSIVATNASGAGAESASVTVVLPVTGPPPGAPAGLSASVAGTTAVFTWNPPASGGPVTNYILLAGTTPGFTNPVASLTLGGTPGTSVPNVPPGTYYVRVYARNNGGLSAASNEVSLTVQGPTVPGAPTLNPASVVNRTVTLSWTAGSGTTTSYALRAYLSGGPLVASANGITATGASFANVPPGVYEVEVMGVNAVGASAPSNRITVTVP